MQLTLSRPELRNATKCAKITGEMLGREYGQNCSAARTLELIGERWTMLVIRDVFSGRRRFDQIQESLGVARNVLSTRLQLLVDEGILEKRAYQEKPERHEYFLTDEGARPVARPGRADRLRRQAPVRRPRARRSRSATRAATAA